MRLSSSQRQALAALSERTLRQLADLGGVTERTLQSLCRRNLARRCDLKPPTIYQVAYHTFYLLTPAGAATIARARP